MQFSRQNMLLYAVTDRSWVGKQTLYQQIELALKGGCTLLQLREKNLPFEELFKEAKKIKQLAHAYNVPLIINDNVDIALACDADGVHIGQEDMNAREARKKLGPSKIIGVTAKTVEQAVNAQKAGADYLGSGAIFGSHTKKNAKPMTKALLTDICHAVDIPVVAIGGINKGNVQDLVNTGISGIAVVSGIFAAEDIEKETRQLLSLSKDVVG